MSEEIPDEALAEENRRLRMLIGELLDATGLDDAERTEWLDRNRLSESAVYPDDDEDDGEPLPSFADSITNWDAMGHGGGDL